MGNSNYIIYLVKEYAALIFYFIVICNIIFRVIQSKKSKKRKRKGKTRKGGGVYDFVKGILLILQCIVSFGIVCNTQWFEAIDELPTPRELLNPYFENSPGVETKDSSTMLF